MMAKKTDSDSSGNALRKKESHAVGGASDDSAGISGSFAEHEQALGIHAFKRLVVAAHTERAAGAGFGGDNQAFFDESGNLLVEILESLGEALANGFVHPVPQIALYESAGIGGFRERFVFAVGEERLDALGWSGVVLAADRIGVTFDFALEFESAKELVACGDGHSDGAVGKGTVASAVAHAVGGKGPGLRGAGHQNATRAHAETVGATCFVQCRGGEEIFSGTREFGVYI